MPAVAQDDQFHFEHLRMHKRITKTMNPYKNGMEHTKTKP